MLTAFNAPCFLLLDLERGEPIIQAFGSLCAFYIEAEDVADGAG